MFNVKSIIYYLLATASGVSFNCAADAVFATNEGSGTVSVIDVETDTVVKTFTVGDKPRGAAVSLDKKILYVSDQPHNALIVIDLTTYLKIDETKLASSPEGVGISNDGKWVVVANEEHNSVSFVNASTYMEAK